MVSVLQDWVMELPLREQATLMTAVRGCDLTPKYPLDSSERRLVASIRWAFLIPADPREVDREPGSFMSSKIPTDLKPSALGHYPWHWVSHVMHAAEVIAYRHPNADVSEKFLVIYKRMAHSFHLNVESRDEFTQRLSEDRIKTGAAHVASR